ncbi:stalk domain-containing protein [Wukongibacter baidiensis]|uniref:stalk domain-containing protein n=1 Tax=Wukongibacter baidiensis TaxID=1723361 RepID=UPI003D7F3938
MKKAILITLFISLFLSNTSSYANSYVMYTAQPGDSYWKISDKYDVSLDELKSINQDTDDTIEAGSLVKIRKVSSNKTIKVMIDDEILDLDEEPYIENARTFVPIRFIAEALNVDEILWDDESRRATLVNDSKTIELTLGSNIAKVNGKEVELDAPISVHEGRTFVPVRFVSEIFDCIVKWDYENYMVLIDTDNSSAEDLYWLSRIVHAEADGESFEGKLAVANVIINRKNSPDFPDTIKDVVFDTKHGYQYTPAANGTVFNSPSSESIRAATLALSGNNNISDCLYFLNPRISTNNWIIKNKTFYKRIGLHDFYK